MAVNLMLHLTVSGKVGLYEVLEGEPLAYIQSEDSAEKVSVGKGWLVVSPDLAESVKELLFREKPRWGEIPGGGMVPEDGSPVQFWGENFHVNGTDALVVFLQSLTGQVHLFASATATGDGEYSDFTLDVFSNENAEKIREFLLKNFGEPEDV